MDLYRGVAAAALALGLLIYVVIILPIYGLRNFQRLLALSNPSHRTRARYIHRRNLRWLLICLTVGGWLFLDPRFTLNDLGFRAPSASAFLLTSITMGAVASIPIAVVVARRRGSAIIATRPDRPLMLQSSEDLYAVLSLVVVSAVAEELFYRGFLTALLVGSFAVPTWMAVVVSSAAFGFAHAYQGLRGILRTGLIGFLLATVYLSSGNLFLPIALHLWLDLMALVVVPWLVSQSSRPAT